MIIHYSLSDIPTIIDKHLMPRMKTASIFTLTGPLGAGKTTLMHTWLAHCGVKEAIVSPTFTYVHIYNNKAGQTFFHFDLYRITSIDEFMAMGFEEYLNRPNSYSFIEWPGVIDGLLHQEQTKKRVCALTLGYVEHDFGLRELNISEL